MTKYLEHFAVNKFIYFLLAAIMLNAGVVYLTEQQKTLWFGNTISPDYNKSNRTLQFKHTMTTAVTYYRPSTKDLSDDSVFFEYDFKLVAANKAVLTNDKEVINTLYHQYFALDDTCIISFRDLTSTAVSSVSLYCLYE